MKTEPLEVGKNYIIDFEYSNPEEVTVLAIHGKHFYRVKNGEGYEWDTMCDRLSPINLTEH